MPSDKEKRSGRVAFDARGQAIWEWEIAPGVFSTDPGTDHLEVLDASASPLSLEEPGHEGALPPSSGWQALWSTTAARASMAIADGWAGHAGWDLAAARCAVRALAGSSDRR